MHIPDAARKTAGNALLSAGPRQSCYPGHIAPASLKLFLSAGHLIFPSLLSGAHRPGLIEAHG